MSVETLEFLIEELRVQALFRATETGLSAADAIEWDLADTLDAVRLMLIEAEKQGGEAAALAVKMRTRLLAASVDRYREHRYRDDD